MQIYFVSMDKVKSTKLQIKQLNLDTFWEEKFIAVLENFTKDAYNTLLREIRGSPQLYISSNQLQDKYTKAINLLMSFSKDYS